MKRTIFSWVVILLGTIGVHAQNTSEEKAVLAVINQLFEGMHQGDSALVRQTFTDTPDMYTVLVTQAGETVLQRGELQPFLASIGTPRKEPLSEPLWNTEVKIDGYLAYVWTDYAFYVGKQFSHCGVDAFTLVKLNGRWKIFQVTDTRQKQNCQVPEAIQQQFE